MKEYYVYILAGEKNGTLYVGVTSNLVKRIYQHKSKETKGFVSKYLVNKLVYYESTNCIYEAINREKKLKKWRRSWKLKLIEAKNPEWKDLFEDIF